MNTCVRSGQLIYIYIYRCLLSITPVNSLLPSTAWHSGQLGPGSPRVRQGREQALALHLVPYLVARTAHPDQACVIQKETKQSIILLCSKLIQALRNEAKHVLSQCWVRPFPGVPWRSFVREFVVTSPRDGSGTFLRSGVVVRCK